MSILENKENIDIESYGHAFIFYGEEKDSLFLFALNKAKTLLSFNTIKELKRSINFKIVEKEKDDKEIKLRVIKEGLKFLSLGVAGGKFKVLLIKDADLLNENSANALLKTLEEPNKNAILILTTENINKILPTILSRTIKLKVLTNYKNNVKLRSKKEFDLFKSIINSSVTDRFSIIEKISKRDRVDLVLMSWISFFHDIFYIKNDLNDFVRNKDYLFDLIDISKKYSTENVNFILDEILKKITLIKDTNVNTRVVLDNIVLKF